MTPKKPILLTYGEPLPDDRRLARITEYFGVGCELLSASGLEEVVGYLSAQTAPQSPCLITSASSLAALLKASDSCDAETLIRLLDHVFIYGFSPSIDVTLLGPFTAGISSITKFAGSDPVYKVERTQRAITAELTGVEVSPISNSKDFGFVLDANGAASFSTLVSIRNLPLFGYFIHGTCQIFLLASTQVADIDQKLAGEFQVSDHFVGLVPFAMFLKHKFSELCWHNPRRLGAFLIDDPLLKKAYGFLNYRDLLEKTGNTAFSATVAFIPWNYKRTDPETAKLLQSQPDKLSICVHGCDHTKGEFAIDEITELNARCKLASERMEAHYKLSGVPYSRVMVFPQGRFSVESLTALKGNNYAAAINSHSVPANADSNYGLALREFLDLAVTYHQGFPLFIRKYPAQLVDLAFDLFLGKPCLVVEHHQYFKHGYGDLLEFIDTMKSLCPEMEWKGVNEVIGQQTLQRRLEDGSIECKIYTNDQVITNYSDATETYVVRKREAGKLQLDYLAVNGQEQTDYVLAGEWLQFTLRLEPRESVRITIGYRNDIPGQMRAHKITETMRVYTRRVLSELRDNVLSKNDLLLTVASGIKARLV